jgi:hypothetical protein
MTQNNLTLIFDLIYSGIFFGSLSYLYFFLYTFFFTNSTLNLLKIKLILTRVTITQKLHLFLMVNTISTINVLYFIVINFFNLDFFKLFCFFSWIVLIAISLYRFYFDTKLLLANTSFKFHFGVLAIYLVPILLIYLSTPVSCCVGENVLNASKCYNPSANDFRMLLCPNSKILVPKNRLMAPIQHNTSLFTKMHVGQEYSIFPIRNKVTGAIIYQFLPRPGFNLPPSGGNYFLRQYSIYHLYAGNLYWPDFSSEEMHLWNKPMYMLDFENVSALSRGRMIDFFAGGGTLQNPYRFFDS